MTGEGCLEGKRDDHYTMRGTRNAHAVVHNVIGADNQRRTKSIRAQHAIYAKYYTPPARKDASCHPQTKTSAPRAGGVRLKALHIC